MLVVAAVVAFYALGKQDLWLRTAALMVVLARGGRDVLHLGSRPPADRLRSRFDPEVKKVVWPTRKEALQMTGYVFAFVLVMAMFLWLTDKTLEWVLYDLILGWKR